MARSKFISNKNKATSIFYFILYVFACLLYWQFSTIDDQLTDDGINTSKLALLDSVAFSSANDLLESALVQNPFNAHLQSNLETFQKLHHTTKAVEQQLTVSCKQRPENPKHLHNHARFLLAKGKYAEAEKHLIKAIALSPSFGESELLLMDVYHRSENWTQLQKLSTELTGTKTDISDAIKYLKIARKRTTVIDVMKETVKNDPSPLNHLILSKELYAKKRFAQSLHHANLAVQMQNDLSGARLLLGLAYAKLGESQKAIKILKTGLNLNPELQSTQQSLAKLEDYSNEAMAYH
ncbi:tetratricopeptide repeat protein [Flagellimonas sp. 2504JD1-5]